MDTTADSTGIAGIAAGNPSSLPTGLPSDPFPSFAPVAAPPLERAALVLGRHGLTPRQLGAAGEDYAAEWLVGRGWRILSRNWRCRFGELDLVALDPNREIAFIEVKTRRSHAQGSPQEAVDRRKQTNLRRAAMDWLMADDHYVPHRGTRFDVIAIRMTPSGPEVTHIPGAF